MANKMKKLIVNADDFGYSFSVNKGIIEAHTNGIVTSTTVMIDAIAAKEAKDLSNYPDLSVGLHFYPKSLNDVEAELTRQIELFEKIVGHKPDSIDTHKRMPKENKEIETAIKKYCAINPTPVRGFGKAKFIRTFFGYNVDGSGTLSEDHVSIDSLKNAINQVTDELNEIMCHVGYSDDYLRANSSYNDTREKELKSICNPTIKKYLEEKEITLCNWKQIKVN